MGAAVRPTSRIDRMLAAVEAWLHRTAGPRVRRAAGIAGVAGAAAISALFTFGTAMLATLLPGGYVALGALALAVIPRALDRVAPSSRLLHVPVIGVIAVLVPVITLLGTDVVWATAGLPRPSPALGLALAAVVVAGAAYAYLLWVRKAPPRHPRRWAVYAGASGLLLTVVTGVQGLDLGVVVACAGAAVATYIYLHRRADPDLRHPLWWALLVAGVMIVLAPLLVEAIEGGKLSPVLLIVGAVMAAIAGLNGLWIHARHHARRAIGISVLAGVALPAAVWAFMQLTSLAPGQLVQRPVPAAAAARALPPAALAHSPILLFDGGERFHTPLDVDRMLASRDVQLCPQGRGLLPSCLTLAGASDLVNGFGNLNFDTQQIADAGLPQTIYVHTEPDKLNPGDTDLDYWWYLPDNPADTARGAMCGAGLVIPEITCFDHQSDWEGMTVVVDKAGDPVAAHYAAHNFVVNYPWPRLQQEFAQRAARYTAGRDVANHPLVFIARGTHAAYPYPCHSATCDGNTVLEDNRHDGTRPWSCPQGTCVTAFPRTATGHPAAWNGFDGHWGSAICVAHIYCARSDAPPSPGRQHRFRLPWCFNYQANPKVGRPPRPAPARTGC
jgi:hypothetical protein